MSEQQESGHLLEEAKKLGAIAIGGDRGIVQFGSSVLPFAKIIVDIMDEPAAVLERVKVWEAAYLEAYPEPDTIKEVQIQEPSQEEKAGIAIPQCPNHEMPMTHRQGVSKKTGQPYDFYGCTVQGAAAQPGYNAQGYCTQTVNTADLVS